MDTVEQKTELTDKAYSVYQILKRSTPLMDGLEDASDTEIMNACKEIYEHLKENADV